MSGESGSPASTEPSPAAGSGSWANRTFWYVVGAAAVGGGVLRIWVALRYQYLPPGGASAETYDGVGLKGDGFDYWMLARSLAAGEGYEGFGPGSSMRPPLWPVLLSLALRVAGGDPEMATLRVFGALLGTGTIVVVALLARRVGGRSAGIVAAVIAAFYPGLWIFEWSLLSETLLLLVLAAFLLAIYRLVDGPSTGAVVLTGGLLGLLCLTRSEQAMLGVLVVLPVVVTRSEWSPRRRLAMLAVAAAATLAVISPWLAYNEGRYENRVFLSAGLANTLRAGACEEALSGEMAGLHTSCFSGYQGRYCQRLLDARDERARFICGQKALDLTFGRSLVAEPDRTVIDEFLLPDVVEYYREDPGQVARGAALRTGRVWGLYRPSHTVSHWQGWSLGHPEAIGAWVYGTWVLVPAAAAGAWQLRRRGRILYPLGAPVVLVVVVTALTIGDVRYRAAAEVPLVVLAAVAASAGIGWWRSRDARRRSDGADHGGEGKWTSGLRRVP